MNKLTAVIIDDEQHCRESLQGLLGRRHPEVDLLGTAEGVPQGNALLAKVRPQLLFLDVEMGRHTGFDLLQTLGPERPHVIFTTAHEGYAVKAIRFSALDYLLKPIDPDELAGAIGKAAQLLRQPKRPGDFLALLMNVGDREGPGTHIALPTAAGPVRLAQQDILFCLADAAGTRVHAAGQGVLPVERELKDFEGMLDAASFMRASPACIVNLKQVERNSLRSDGPLVLKDGTELPMDGMRKRLLLERLGG